MTTLIIGANSEIAKSLAQHINQQTTNQLIVVSRNIDFYRHESFKNITVIDVEDYQEASIISAVSTIKNTATSDISNVFICHGILHNQRCQPEKRLEEFSADAFTEILSANTITPMLWLKHLTPILRGIQPCKLVVFTGRVGSISDNELGGWYSYRASKAALNMLIKSTAVELARRAKNIKLISFHPGTTDSPLSKPFQKNVPAGKLFTSDFVASQLVAITRQTPVDGLASFLDWQGKAIPW